VLKLTHEDRHVVPMKRSFYCTLQNTKWRRYTEVLKLSKARKKVYKLVRTLTLVKVKKGKAIPVTGRGGPKGCETSRLPHFLDGRLTDGSEIISLMRRPQALYPQEDSWYTFLLETVDPRAIVRLEGLGQLKYPITSSGIEPATFWFVT
jgi:hypothetical protein